MEPIKINVEKNDKCYFCGRDKNEVQAIIDDMKKGINEAIKSVEKDINELETKFKNEEKTILDSMNNADLSFKINTLISDAERFKKEIPFFDLWTRDIRDKMRTQNNQRLPPGVKILNGKKIEPMFEKRDYEITINDVMKSLNSYLMLKKEEELKELEELLLELKTIEDSFIEHELKPLVNMTSKPLGQITQNWKNYERNKKTGSSSIMVNEPPKFDMKTRVDNVGFVLTTCHFCYDRFQGSTL